MGSKLAFRYESQAGGLLSGRDFRPELAAGE